MGEPRAVDWLLFPEKGGGAARVWGTPRTSPTAARRRTLLFLRWGTGQEKLQQEQLRQDHWDFLMGQGARLAFGAVVLGVAPTATYAYSAGERTTGRWL